MLSTRVGTHLQKPFESCTAMLGALALEAVWQQHDEAGAAQPLLLPRADELVHNHLRCVCEVAELHVCACVRACTRKYVIFTYMYFGVKARVHTWASQMTRLLGFSIEYPSSKPSTAYSDRLELYTVKAACFGEILFKGMYLLCVWAMICHKVCDTHTPQDIMCAHIHIQAQKLRCAGVLVLCDTHA